MRSRCDPWLSDASALEDKMSSQIYKIISCISLYNGAKVLIFYEIKRIGKEKMSITGQNAWFWSRNRALWAVEKGWERRRWRSSRYYMRSIRYASSIVAELRSMPCGRSIVLSTFKSSFNRLGEKLNKLHSKLNKKSDVFARFCSLNNVTRISLISQIIVFWWYNKIYGKMSKTSFHNYS